MDEADRFRGCLLGLAVGDAIGSAVQFKARGTFTPITDMMGKRPFNLQPGQWSDDTSMVLCFATSLIEYSGFDAKDQMNRYQNWLENGYLSSAGYSFDIGNTVHQALSRYKKTGDPYSGSTDPMSAGNCSIMRLAPAPVFYFPDHNLALHYSAESSRNTHGTAECIDACRLFGDILFRALNGAGKKDILLGINPDLFDSPTIKDIATGEYRSKSEDDIQGTGYLVKSLEAALWCFYKTVTFKDAVIKAANLGNDADTTTAVCGQVAGAFYGESNIPTLWLDRLVMREKIRLLADKLHWSNFE